MGSRRQGNGGGGRRKHYTGGIQGSQHGSSNRQKRTDPGFDTIQRVLVNRKYPSITTVSYCGHRELQEKRERKR